MTTNYLTPQQRNDIKASLAKIKEDITQIQNTVILTDSELLYFYEELEKKANHAHNFIKCAQMYSRIEAGEQIKID